MRVKLIANGRNNSQQCLTWDQAQFSFRFVNNIPAGKGNGGR